MNMLTRTECTALRGLAIAAIVLHNYCHFIGKIVQENEYLYLERNNERLWQVLTHPDALLPVHLLSYFGHYGVPVFLFLSGFGLVSKYEHAHCDALPFLRYNYLKLLRMLIVGFVLFVFVDTVTPGRFHFHWYNVLAQLSMTINLLPTPESVIWPGIYWFFGLMMELYVVYRLLLYRRSSLLVVGLIAVCWLLQLSCDPAGAVLNRLRYNFVGGMLPFGAGILLARHGDRIPALSLRPYGWLLVSMATFALAFALCFHFHSWLWIPLPVIVASVALVRSLPQSLFCVAEWIGSLSAAMFVAHPIARKLLIIVAWKDDIYDGLMLYVVVTIGLSWAVKQIIDHIPAPKL
jgi:hypothetical protein